MSDILVKTMDITQPLDLSYKTSVRLVKSIYDYPPNYSKTKGLRINTQEGLSSIPKINYNHQQPIWNKLYRRFLEYSSARSSDEKSFLPLQVPTRSWENHNSSSSLLNAYADHISSDFDPMGISVSSQKLDYSNVTLIPIDNDHKSIAPIGPSTTKDSFSTCFKSRRITYQHLKKYSDSIIKYEMERDHPDDVTKEPSKKFNAIGKKAFLNRWRQREESFKNNFPSSLYDVIEENLENISTLSASSNLQSTSIPSSRNSTYISLPGNVGLQSTEFICGQIHFQRTTTCTKKFKNTAVLKLHLKREENITTGKFTCPLPECQKRFVQKSALNVHFRIHSGALPYECKFCRIAFRDKSTHTKHVRTHTQEKPYSCAKCNFRFSQSGNLIRHMRYSKRCSLGKYISKPRQLK